MAERSKTERISALCGENQALAAALVATKARLAEARLGLSAVEVLINESEGVSGLHLNGDIAAWESLRRDGRFSEWLYEFDIAIDAARAAVSAVDGLPPIGHPRSKPERMPTSMTSADDGLCDDCGKDDDTCDCPIGPP